MSKYFSYLFLAAALLLTASSPATAETSVMFVQPSAAVPVPLPVDASNYPYINCAVGCSASAGPSFGSAFPAQGVAIGVKNGANLDWLTSDGSRNLNINCVVGCSGGTASNAGSGVATSSTNGTVNSWLYGFNGATWDQLQVDGSKSLKVTIVSPSTLTTQILPSASNTLGITPAVSTAAESSHVLCNTGSSCNFYSAYITTGATAGYLLITNTTSAPADGAVTPLHCIQVAANSSASISTRGGPPDIFSTGITAIFSTTGCFTKTASATAFFSGDTK